jgi:hypothetical protein
MINFQEALLTMLSQEAGKITLSTSECLLYGTDKHFELLKKDLHSFLAVIELMRVSGLEVSFDVNEVKEQASKKVERLRESSEYLKELVRKNETNH